MSGALSAGALPQAMWGQPKKKVEYVKGPEGPFFLRQASRMGDFFAWGFPFKGLFYRVDAPISG